jgi:hypothetical protein
MRDDDARDGAPSDALGDAEDASSGALTRSAGGMGDVSRSEIMTAQYIESRTADILSRGPARTGPMEQRMSTRRNEIASDSRPQARASSASGLVTRASSRRGVRARRSILGALFGIAGLCALASCSLEPETSMLAVSQQGSTAPKVDPGDDLERAYADLDRSYQAAKRRALDEIDRRRANGEKVADSEIANAASEHWPRFQALADKGSGHARLWMALEMQSAFPARERATNQKEALKLLDAVVADSANAPWIGELAKSLTALYVTLPESEVDRIVDALAAKSTQKDVVAEALYRSASFDKSSQRSGAAARADDLTKRLQRDYTDTEYGRKARGDEPRTVGLRIGNEAPDFTTQDADGVAFKLSDYRGKVVVLDFWGFW